ncbi:helix-turn-helix transcriptional regulator [Geminicoccus flavidas]|uniref:helix-turn-helix transcriptional regulator n=1 Tax=Geminicoccus flavidas TaxID=2506407 RepID=UPI0013578277|nr:helix-turn-helix domain-containing protein [Geminicoccus flavidas]
MTPLPPDHPADRTADRLLHALKSGGPQAAAGLADRLSITPSAVRQHLDRLLALGRVGFEDRREGVGRPRRYWHLTAEGQAGFPDGHAELALELLAAVPALFGRDGLEALIVARAAASAARYRAALEGLAEPGPRLAALARLRAAEGFMAELVDEDDGDALLVQNHCPIMAAAGACQALCQAELAMFGELLGPGTEIQRAEHIAAGDRRCSYRIRPAA